MERQRDITPLALSLGWETKHWPPSPLLLWRPTLPPGKSSNPSNAPLRLRPALFIYIQISVNLDKKYRSGHCNQAVNTTSDLTSMFTFDCYLWEMKPLLKEKKQIDLHIYTWASLRRVRRMWHLIRIFAMLQGFTVCQFTLSKVCIKRR